MIDAGSKWQHKDGGVYEVVTILDININTLVNTLKNYKRTIWYKDQDGEIYARTEKHFLTSFKPYEPVYEWRWAYQDAQDCPRIATRHYTTYEEAHEDIVGHPNILQRLDFTKRERE